MIESTTGLATDGANNSAHLSRYPLRCVSIVCDFIVEALFPVQSSEGNMNEMESVYDEDFVDFRTDKI